MTDVYTIWEFYISVEEPFNWIQTIDWCLNDLIMLHIIFKAIYLNTNKWQQFKWFGNAAYQYWSYLTEYKQMTAVQRIS